MYRIEFFNRNVEKDILSWPVGIQADFLKIVELMMHHGSDLGAPKTKAIEKGLFEIRAKGKEGIGRAFYCTRKGERIIILHGFIKKSQKTPKRDLDIARKRIKEIKND